MVSGQIPHLRARILHSRTPWIESVERTALSASGKLWVSIVARFVGVISGPRLAFSDGGNKMPGVGLGKGRCKGRGGKVVR